MSRDPGDPGEPTNPERDAELLAAYVDGVAELSPDERHRVEAQLARDPQARTDQAAMRALLDQLRALPPAGAEPDWTAMERSIRQAVGHEVPRPWWRRWTWLAPTTMLATAAAVVLVMWARPAPVVEPETRPVVRPVLGPAADRDAREARHGEDTVALWLDGAEVDVDLSASELLGEGAPGDPGYDAPVSPDAEADAEPGLLPSADLAWVDRLDDAALDRAERWLARKKG